jgi:subtilase family serine protease
MLRVAQRLFIIAAVIAIASPAAEAQASSRLDTFRARPPIHVRLSGKKAPSGLTPSDIKKVYHLPASGGQGTIALVGAYDDPTIENDLGVFSAAFGLAPCTAKNGCLEKHLMAAGTKKDGNWSLETSLDVEWAHAIAPQAKILLVEAKTSSGKNLLEAVDYAAKRPDVVAISMSWGGGEFAGETDLDSHFTSPAGAAFFASSGDAGAGVSWPAVSPNVVAVGGTSLSFGSTTSTVHETAWSGSGGGVSAYVSQPAYQTAYKIAKAKNQRAVPDVAYDADPASGFSVYRTTGKSKNGWYTVGGTSAGAPQWAAIRALGLSASNDRFYADKATANSAHYFRDITSGANGDCAYYCEARRHYDYVTGLGTPLTVNF